MECGLVEKMIVMSAVNLRRADWQVELSSSKKKKFFQEKDIKPALEKPKAMHQI